VIPSTSADAKEQQPQKKFHVIKNLKNRFNYEKSVYHMLCICSIPVILGTSATLTETQKNRLLTLT
jgi:hypothetical protein